MSDDGQEYRKESVYYKWMQEFDRQKNAVSLAILDLLEEYPQEAVYAAMLDLVRKDYRRDLREWYGERHGDDYLPPQPDGAFVCSSCGDRFETDGDRADHMRNVHSTED